jgi:hypothetical protein
MSVKENLIWANPGELYLRQMLPAQHIDVLGPPMGTGILTSPK